MMCDFLLSDYHVEALSFSRFEECLLPFTKNLKLRLPDIFLEICGKNKKYITFPRLVKAYLAYKRNDPNHSLEFKKFFSFIFTEVLKVVK